MTKDDIIADYLRSDVLTLTIIRARRVDFDTREGRGIRLRFVGQAVSGGEIAALNASGWWPVGEIGGAYTHLIRSGAEFWAAACIWI
ncbi:hypothetical protein M0R72_06440 [Candidatus Pacearchaeota archaeon]|jgi:hypothetical protein|nr:hypothetical protein [Candidatus Pacearchaeota archaeon]